MSKDMQVAIVAGMTNADFYAQQGGYFSWARRNTKCALNSEHKIFRNTIAHTTGQMITLDIYPFLKYEYICNDCAKAEKNIES